LSKDLQFISFSQYEYGSKLINEIGRMLGGWYKKNNDLNYTPIANSRPGFFIHPLISEIFVAFLPRNSWHGKHPNFTKK